MIAEERALLKSAAPVALAKTFAVDDSRAHRSMASKSEVEWARHAVNDPFFPAKPFLPPNARSDDLKMADRKFI
jgi:hypothetical protein